MSALRLAFPDTALGTDSEDVAFCFSQNPLYPFFERIQHIQRYKSLNRSGEAAAINPESALPMK